MTLEDQIEKMYLSVEEEPAATNTNFLFSDEILVERSVSVVVYL